MNVPVTAQTIDPQTLNLRDIHLPDPISWCPLAPGWWISLSAVVIAAMVIFLGRRIYRGRRLKRDILSELDNIKQQYAQTRNRTLLARSLSVLLRRACISYFPVDSHAQMNIAGLTGEAWLRWLDETDTSGTLRFQSDTGELLLSAPYLPDDATIDFDADELLALCESWLLENHRKQSAKLRGVPA